MGPSVPAQITERALYGGIVVASVELTELPVEYRYQLPSAVVGRPTGARLRLATSGGPSPNPRFFEGRLLHPLVASDLLLTIADVARSRFHVPAQALRRILELADPVATCADERIRFEAFSACASVYGRVDLRPGSFEGDVLARGTTNVDFGADLRTALAGIRGGEALELAVGATQVEVRTERHAAVERRVPLPSRWLRGFLEVGAVQPELEPVAKLDARGTRSFFRSVPRAPTKRPVWIVAGGRDVRLVHHDPGGGAPRLAGLERLRLFDRLSRHADSLRIFAGADGCTGWQLDVPAARLTLVLSPEVWRGLSGEGRALHRLAGTAKPMGVAAVRGSLGWQPRLDVAALAVLTGRSAGEVDGALAALAASGVVGYDLAERGFFRRELPFDLERIERSQPRLREARRLVARGGVHIEDGVPGLEAWVQGTAGIEYRVRSTDDGWRCTCPWYGRHHGDRGPCKHILAVQIRTADDAG